MWNNSFQSIALAVCATLDSMSVIVKVMILVGFVLVIARSTDNYVMQMHQEAPPLFFCLFDFDIFHEA
jgi:hypothetical protein